MGKEYEAVFDRFGYILGLIIEDPRDQLPENVYIHAEPTRRRCHHELVSDIGPTFTGWLRGDGVARRWGFARRRTLLLSLGGHLGSLQLSGQWI